MDAVIFITIALVLFAMQVMQPNKTSENGVEYSVEDVTREAKLNDSFYEDEDAFSEIIHALGFPRGDV